MGTTLCTLKRGLIKFNLSAWQLKIIIDLLTYCLFIYLLIYLFIYLFIYNLQPASSTLWSECGYKLLTEVIKWTIRWEYKTTNFNKITSFTQNKLCFKN